MRILCVAIFLSFSYSLVAQPPKTGNWLIYFGNAPMGKSWNWHHEVQWRNYNIAGDLEQLLIRTGLGRDLSPGNNNLLLGYGFVRSENYTENEDEKTGFNEHRIYQQFITRQQFGRVYLQHRYRFEQRIFEDDFRTRFRYFLSLNVPINRPRMDKGSLYLSAYNEIFINGGNELFDRNRLYGAVGYQLLENTRLEMGMMSQIYRDRSRPQFQVVIFNNLLFCQPKESGNTE